MFRVICVVVTCAVTLAILGCGDDPVEPKPLQNRVYFDNSMTVTGGDEFSVNVYFENAQPLGAISLPLSFSTAVLRCDSVSFAGGRCADFLFRPYFISADTIQLAAIDVDTSQASSGYAGIEPGQGLFVRLYFWAHGNAPDTTVEIGVHNNPTLPLAYADTSLSSALVVPAFEPLSIQINSQVVR